MGPAAALCAACLAALPLTPQTVARASLAQAESPAVAETAGLTLDRVLAQVRDQWPALRGMRERARAATDSVGAAARWPNPSADVSSENWRPGGRAASDPGLDTFAVLTQPVEIAGQRGARRRVAAAQSQMTTEELAGEERTVALAVTDTFLRVIRARDRLRVLEAQRDGTVEIVALLRRRVEEGVTAEADLRKVEADLGRAAIDAARAGAEMFAALAALGAFLGVDPPPAAAALVLPAAVSAGAAFDMEAALGRRADVRAARSRVALAAAAADLEQRRRWPDLLVSAGYKRTAGIDTGVAGVSVPIPLFDRNERARALAWADHRAAEFDRQRVEAVARADIAGARAAAATLAALALRVEEDLVVPAEVARRAARSSFREGAGDILRWLDAERVFTDAAREAVDVRVDAALAASRARIAAGEVWP